MSSRWVVAAVMGLSAGICLAQTPPAAPPPPLVIGRDPREPVEVIGKNFQLRVWLSDVGGAGMQKIHVARVGADGNITLPGTPPQHAEGLTIAALEAQVAAPYKAASPKAAAWISIVDRTPPAPPPPPPAPAPAPAAAVAPAAPAPAPPAAPTPPKPSPPAAAPAPVPAPVPATQAATKPATKPTTNP